ncbi:MAG: type II secretion system F family protein [Firmicutes bacterium]|nr:type II secretion system F family protein [Bacillota bacterium]
MTDYRIYKLSSREIRDFVIIAGLALFFTGYLFYRSFAASAVICLCGLAFLKPYTEFKRKRRLEALSEGFRDALYAVSGAVAAGRQLPQALAAAADMSASAFGEDSDIAKELRYITRIYEETHAEPDALLSDLGTRSGLEEISQFASACSICRRAGGDLESVALKSAALILDKLEFDREVRSMVGKKKLDIAILVSMPVIILAFLNYSSPDYLDPLYTTAGGRVLMTLSLALIAAALLWGLKIISIKM